MWRFPLSFSLSPFCVSFSLSLLCYFLGAFHYPGIGQGGGQGGHNELPTYRMDSGREPDLCVSP
jgi:hypothetical protein